MGVSFCAPPASSPLPVAAWRERGLAPKAGTCESKRNALGYSLTTSPNFPPHCIPLYAGALPFIDQLPRSSRVRPARRTHERAATATRTCPAGDASARAGGRRAGLLLPLLVLDARRRDLEILPGLRVLRVQLERKLVQVLGRRCRAELQHEIPVIVLALRVGWQREWEWAAVGNGPGKRRRAGAGERGGGECGHPHTKERGKGQQAAGRQPTPPHQPEPAPARNKQARRRLPGLAATAAS